MNIDHRSEVIETGTYQSYYKFCIYLNHIQGLWDIYFFFQTTWNTFRRQNRINSHCTTQIIYFDWYDIWIYYLYIWPTISTYYVVYVLCMNLNGLRNKNLFMIWFITWLNFESLNVMVLKKSHDYAFVCLLFQHSWYMKVLCLVARWWW